MKTIGYLRVSKDTQDLNNQRHEILEYGQRNALLIDDFIAIEVPSRKERGERRIDEVLEKLKVGDTFIVSELSRLGRSTGEVIGIVDELIEKEIRFIAIKQNWTVNGRTI